MDRIKWTESHGVRRMIERRIDLKGITEEGRMPSRSLRPESRVLEDLGMSKER